MAEFPGIPRKRKATAPAPWLVRTVLPALLLATLALAGCGRQPEPPPAPAFSMVALVDGRAPAPVVRAVREGLATVERELDAAAVLRSVGEGGARLRSLRGAGEEGRDLVLCFCPDFDHVVFEEATAYPDTFFVTIPGRTSGPNVGSVVFELRGAGYLAGVALREATGGGRIALVIPPGGGEFGRGWEEGVGVAAGGEGAGVTLSAPQAVRALREGTVAGVLYGGVAPPEDLEAACSGAGAPLVVIRPSREPEVGGGLLGAVVVDLEAVVAYLAQEAWAGTLEGDLVSFSLGSAVVDFRLAGDAPGDVAAAVRTARREVLSGLAEVESLGM